MKRDELILRTRQLVEEGDRLVVRTDEGVLRYAVDRVRIYTKGRIAADAERAPEQMRREVRYRRVTDADLQQHLLVFGALRQRLREHSRRVGQRIDAIHLGLSERGELFVAPATPDAFKPIAQAQVIGGKNWTVPVLANRRIHCRNARGDVVCLDVGKK